METLQRTANRGSISTGYDITNSLKFERANGEQIFTSNAAAGNRKTWTFSAWIKRTQLSQDYSTVFSCGYSNIQFMGNDRPRLILYNGSSEVYADPEMLMRDTSAWYHIVVQVDSTQSTAADRVKWWINGDRITDFNNSTYTNMSQNEEFDFGQAGSGSGNWIRLGEFFGGSEGFGGYMADVYYLNGTAAQASDFGEYDSDSGIWIPKEYTGGGYGTQGFYYKFDNASNLGEDSSGEGHDANNLNNITSTDQATDTPTNNFATWNVAVDSSVIFSYTEGATKWKPTSAAWASTTASLGFTKGKWYAEFKAASNVTNVMVGVQELEKTANYVGGHLGVSANSTSEGYGYYNANGNVYNNTTSSSYGNSFPLSVLVGVALDFKDDGTALMYISKDNVWQNSADPVNGTGGYSLNSGSVVEGFFSFAGSLYTSADYLQANFGGYTVNTISTPASDENGYGTFEYAPPSGYYALCTKNLAEFG